MQSRKMKKMARETKFFRKVSLLYYCTFLHFSLKIKN